MVMDDFLFCWVSRRLHHNTDLWRATDAVPGDPKWANWPSGLAWLSEHLGEHLDYRWSDRFARDTALPVLRAVCEFWLDLLVDDGGLVVSPSTSPENLFVDGESIGSVTRGATLDQELVRSSLSRYLDLVSRLDSSDSFAEECAAARCSSRNIVRMKTHGAFHPHTDVHLGTDMLPRGARIRARVRWTDPVSRRRRSHSITVDSDAEAEGFFDLMRSRFGNSIDPLISFESYARRIGDRFLRGVDMTSTAAGYRAGLQLRVIPALGHLPVYEITAGIVDRIIDGWETTHSPSTLKNTIAALTRVLDEAVRDELIARNPARDRANRRYRSRTDTWRARQTPKPGDAKRIATACACRRRLNLRPMRRLESRPRVRVLSLPGSRF
jgi:hypothetical protein